MTDISVIIVNYNVKHFLRQCIESVVAATHDLSVETIVVDNTSVDGSVQMLKEEFPSVTCIENTDNVGFSKANNQGIALAKGKYVLLLNPDTIIQEDTLMHCYQYAEQNTHVGAIGVKMLDGSGSYLPESKRGFPTAMAAFCKITGLYKFFPRSRRFNAYYAGHIDHDAIGNVDVLCGAFMYMRRDVVNQVGGLDEDYWMYGEDIDLSYQIQKAGYEITYLPTTSIIHYKGESTKKSSRKYNTAFYGAMQIFLSKHFTDRSSQVTLATLKIAVVTVGALSYLKHIGGKVAAWLIDVAVSLAILLSLVPLWAHTWHGGSDYFDQSPYLYWIVGIVVGLMLLLFVIGHYDDDARRRRYVPAVLLYGGGVLVFYSLLPEQCRFSRVLVVLSSLLPGMVAFLSRLIRNRIHGFTFAYEHNRKRRLAVVGNKASISIIEGLLGSQLSQCIVARIAPSSHINNGKPEYDKSYYLTDLNHIQDVCNIMEVNEIIYCSRDLSMSAVFSSMSRLGANIRYRIANHSNQAVLGSDSQYTLGKWYTEELAFNINTGANKRLKRLIDILICIINIVCSPYLILRSKRTRQLLTHLPQVLGGRLTWWGYPTTEELPVIRQSVFDVKDQYQPIQQLNILHLNYAKNYSVWQDITMWINLIIYG